MGGLALGLLASLAWGVADFVGGVQARRMPVLSMLLVSQPVGLVTALIWLASAGGQRPSLGELVGAAAAGVAGALALGALWAAMARGMLGLASPISATGVLVPVTYGLARGESPRVLQLAGATLAIGGVIVAVRTPRLSMRPVRRDELGIVLALGAALGFGALFVGVAVAARRNPAWAVSAARAGGCSALFAGVLVAGVARRTAAPGRRQARPARRVVALAPRKLTRLGFIGVLDVGGSSLYALATHSGHISLVAVVASLYPAVTVILAAGLLGERLGRTQRIGVLMTLIGVGAIAAGS